MSKPAEGGAPSLLNTMKLEHCAMPDSRQPFRTSNGMEGVLSEQEWEFVLAPSQKKEYAERGGDFRAEHPEWCRQALPLGVFELRMAQVNRKLAAKGLAQLIKEEVVGGRLYTGRAPATRTRWPTSPGRRVLVCQTDGRRK